MKPAPFEYHAPESLGDALSLLGEHGSDAKLLAGGQSLVPAMNFRVVQPAMLIDLNRVPELSYIRVDRGKMLIGAMTRERQLEFDASVAEHSPLLAEAIRFVAHPQIRNRGTLGGSLANADPAAELPVIMLALGARFKVGTTTAERWLDAKDFFLGLFTTALEPNEMLVEIELPPSPAHTGWAFMEVAPRPGDYALMGVAAALSLDGRGTCTKARLVYLNAGDGPLDAVQAAALLEGQTPTDALFREAAAFASGKEMDPFGNIHATPAFQRHLADVLTQRALQRAFERARKDGTE